jgi:hypothetical protein
MQKLPQEDQETATLITAVHRGDTEGLRNILSAAAADSGACFVDVVIAGDVPPNLVATAHALVQEVSRKVQGSSTRASGKGHAPSKGGILRGFRVVDRAEYDEAMGRAEYDEAEEWKAGGLSGGKGCVWQGYHVIMEDSINYPDEYLQHARQSVEGVYRRAMIGYAGLVWNVEFIKVGLPYSQVIHAIPSQGLAAAVEVDVWVDVLRLGTIAFHASASVSAARPAASLAMKLAAQVALDPPRFVTRASHGLEHIQLAVEAHYLNVPRLLCARPAGFLLDRAPQEHAPSWFHPP